MKTIKTWRDLKTLTAEDVKAMTKAERNALSNRCAQIMDADKDRDHAAYNAYFLISSVYDEEYQTENEPKIREFFQKHFAGKTWSQIRSDAECYDNWSFYSDWHKDVFGYRPHGIVCGVYVSPY